MANGHIVQEVSSRHYMFNPQEKNIRLFENFNGKTQEK